MVEGERHTPGQERREYVLGFAIEEKSKYYVLLIKKIKPPWQAGKLNGIGGKIEEGESPFAAMTREFQEETWIETTSDDWKKFAVLSGEGFKIHIFSCFLSIVHFLSPVSPTAEEVICLPVDLVMKNGLGDPLMPNVPWLVAMALSFDRGEHADSFEVEEVTVELSRSTTGDRRLLSK